MATPFAVRASRIGLWALVVLGACGGVVGAVHPSAPTPWAAPTQVGEDAPAEVAGAAELAVRHFLLSGELGARTVDSSSSLPTDADGDIRLEMLFSATVASRRVDAGYWAVTVAAEVRPPGAPNAAAALWFLEVGVVAGPEGTAVAGAPAVVAPPPTAAIGLAGTALAVPRPGDPLAETAASFLQALLTGAGDITRYLAPGVSVAPAAPPPFAALTVQRTATVSASPKVTVLRVEASAVTAEDIELLVVYELTLRDRDGRWEVSALSGAPTLRRSDRPAGSPSRSATTTRPATTVPPSVSAPGA